MVHLSPLKITVPPTQLAAIVLADCHTREIAADALGLSLQLKKSDYYQLYQLYIVGIPTIPTIPTEEE
jgi:hypothetical protein